MANIIDVLTSVHVMDHETLPEGWSPSNNSEHSDKILDKLHADGIANGTEDARALVVNEDGDEIRPGEFAVRCWIGEGDERVEAVAPSEPYAVCLAALKRAGVNHETGE